MSNFEFFGEGADTFSFPNDSFYHGTYTHLSLRERDSWSEAQSQRGDYLDWLTTELVFQMYPGDFDTVPGINLERMRMHESVYAWYCEHPTDQELANAQQ